MTPDELVAEIFRIQEERDPDSDPGDMDITIQDDMPLVIVRQQRIRLDMTGGSYGDSIQDALENYLKEVIDGGSST
jgi:predicted PolB exonuclease-like 3'-5' exonuclease